jgi:hypothetical protein
MKRTQRNNGHQKGNGDQKAEEKSNGIVTGDVRILITPRDAVVGREPTTDFLLRRNGLDQKP